VTDRDPLAGQRRRGRTEDDTGRAGALEPPAAAGRESEPPGAPGFGALGQPLMPRAPLTLVGSEPLGAAGPGPLAARALALWGAPDEDAATGDDEDEGAPAMPGPATAGDATAPVGATRDVEVGASPPPEVSIADLSPASVVFVPASRGATRPPIWAAPEAAFARPPTELLVAAAAADAGGGRPALARADVSRDGIAAPGSSGTLSTTEAPFESGPPPDPRQLAEQVYALIRRRLAVESERAGLLPSRRRW
jgi:hypothetical protein